MMIFYSNICARLIHLFVTRKVMRKTQAWRTRQGQNARPVKPPAARRPAA